jgi:hypothetical protein
MNEIRRGIIEARMFARLIFIYDGKGIKGIRGKIEKDYKVTLSDSELRKNFEDEYKKYLDWKEKVSEK